MIESIRNYIATCPYLDTFAAVNVEYLVDKVKAYSVNEGAGYNPVVSETITGDKEMQFQFTFDAKFYWNEEVSNNVNNSEFFEKFRDWLEQNNRNGVFPSVTGITPESINATSNGYIFATNADVAIYRISCVFNYIKPLTESVSA